MGTVFSSFIQYFLWLEILPALKKALVDLIGKIFHHEKYQSVNQTDKVLR